jgi:hypothetical protein
MLDELLVIGITILIIVLNQRAVMSFGEEKAICWMFGGREGKPKGAKPTNKQSRPAPQTGKTKNKQSGKGIFP